MGHYFIPLWWRYNGRDGVSNHQPYDCLLNRLFRHRSKKTSKLRVTGLCVGNSPGTGEFPAQMTSNAENVSISWRHHARLKWGSFSWFKTFECCVDFFSVSFYGAIFDKSSEMEIKTWHSHICVHVNDDPAYPGCISDCQPNKLEYRM